MANKTIPQLPEQTGKTDNDLLAIVDSGETTTSKIKVSTLLSGLGSPFIDGDGTNNVVPDYYTPSSINSSATESGIFMGNGNTISSTGVNNVILGGSGNALTAGDETFFLGGENNTANGGLYGGIVGGRNNTGGGRSYIFGGNNNSVGPDASLVGAFNFTGLRLNSPEGTAVVLGGRYNTTNTNGAQREVFLGGIFNKLYAGNPSEGMVLIGGDGNLIGGGTYASPSQTTVNHAHIENSKSCQISGGTQNEIINSTGSTLNAGTTNTTIISCNGVAGDQSDMVYVPALILANYASYNYPDDATAAANGIQLGGIYHNAGALRVRIV